MSGMFKDTLLNKPQARCTKSGTDLQQFYQQNCNSIFIWETDWKYLLF